MRGGESMKRWICVVLLSVCCCLTVPNIASAAFVYETTWNPPDVFVDSWHPYYFPLNLPNWAFDKENYTKASFEVSFVDQYWYDIMVFVADPATDTSVAGNYNILLGTVPFDPNHVSGTATFDLLSVLDKATFEALFKNQSTLYVVSDCHYYFDKASLHLEASTVPVPPAILLLGSGLLGLLGIRRGMNRS